MGTMEIKVRIEDLKFKVLNELLDLGDKFYLEREAEKEAAKAAKLGPQSVPNPLQKGLKRKKAGLKETDPW